METINLLLGSQAFSPYVISLLLMLVVVGIEVLTAVMGVGLFSFIDSLLPNIDFPDFDLPFSLSFFSFGKVPSSVLLVCFLTFFGIFGILFQLMSLKITGVVSTNYVIVPITIIATFLCVNSVTHAIAKIIPADESYVVSTESFIGKVAVITLGEARQNNPTTARVKDDLGESHKIMVIPHRDGDVFKVGQQVCIVGKEGCFFKVVAM